MAPGFLRGGLRLGLMRWQRASSVVPRYPRQQGPARSFAAGGDSKAPGTRVVYPVSAAKRTRTGEAQRHERSKPRTLEAEILACQSCSKSQRGISISGNMMGVVFVVPFTLGTGDSSVSFKSCSFDEPGPEMLFEFHVTEKCKWYSHSATAPAFTTGTSVVDLVFCERFKNFWDVDELAPSHHVIAGMLSGINFRMETKNLWRSTLALFSRVLVSALGKYHTKEKIMVDIKLLTTRNLHQLSQTVEEIVVQRESEQLVGEPVQSYFPEELWAELKEKLPQDIRDL